MNIVRKYRARWLIGLILVLAAAGLSFVVTMFTLPNVLPGVERAKLTHAPIATSPSARAAAAAIAILRDQEPETLDRTARLATAAIIVDPLEVSAIRSLSFVEAYRGNAEQAMRLLRYGESLSRRDLMTELALGLDAEQKGDNANAIRHYGHALSTTRRGYDLIVTQLLAASADRDFAHDLGQAMARDPLWRDRFLPAFVARSEDPAAMIEVARGMWAAGVPASEQAAAASVTSRLLRLGAQDEAAVLIGLIRGRQSEMVQNGDFEESDRKALGWSYVSGASLSAMPIPDEQGRGRALEVQAGSGHMGTVARQMLSLESGEYMLSARLVANEQADVGMPRVTISCAESDEAQADLRRSPVSEQVNVPFAIPEACSVQYLNVIFGSSMFVSDSRGRVDDIAITRR